MKKGIKNVKNISLSSEEKEDMFAYLDLYTKENPVKEGFAKPSPWFGFLGQVGQIKGHRYVYSLLALLVIVFVGASVTNAAESALPGDVLYPIKINVNEKVKSAVAFTPKAKAKVEEERVIRRLDEAKALVEKGDFKTEKRDQLEKEVEKSVKFLNDNKEKTRKIRSSESFDKKKLDKNNEDYKNENEEDNEKDFEKKLNTRFEEIKKVDIEISKTEEDKNEVKKFEEKIRGQLLNNLDDRKDNDNNRNRNIHNLKINL